MTALRGLATFIWSVTPSRRVRAKYFALYCWLVRGRTKIVAVDGVRLELDLGQTIDVAVSLRKFEREIVNAIHAHTRPGDVVLDIGANAGVHAIVFAKCASPGSVFAFEPTKYAHARLERNVKLNPQLQVRPVRLALSDQNVESAAVRFRSSWRTDGVVDTQSEDISFRRLDDWIEENQLDKVSIVKLDVDGFEYRVLRGAQKTLSRFKPILFMEVGHYHFDDDTTNPVALLSTIGYCFWDAKSHEPMSPIELRKRLTAPEMLDATINVVASAAAGFVP